MLFASHKYALWFLIVTIPRSRRKRRKKMYRTNNQIFVLDDRAPESRDCTYIHKEYVQTRTHGRRIFSYPRVQFSVVKLRELINTLLEITMCINQHELQRNVLKESIDREGSIDVYMCIFVYFLSFSFAYNFVLSLCWAQFNLFYAS